ncbi:MAG: VWA domain-containing protein [Lentisphaeraceae bacterium]|nr:VWA domain-containing protein [Lentisphaeraceae bacterium]
MVEFVNKSWWPITLATLILVSICWYWSEKRRNKTLTALLSTEMAEKLSSSACSVRRIWRNLLFTFAWVVLAFILLRPYSGIDTEERQQSTRDIMILFDASNSMNVVDSYGDSRIKYGKSLISKLIKELPADRFGLMSFAGLAFLECPITSDSYSFETALDDMDSDKIPLGGTNIEIALNQALAEYSEGAPHKAIVLISDGEEIGGDYTEAAEELKKKNIKVVTVQTGDERKAGSVRNSVGKPLRDKQGQLLTSKADSTVLADIAQKTGGIYLQFDPEGYSGNQLQQIANHINTMTTGTGEKEIIQKPREIYQPFLFVAILLLIARMLIGERRKTLQKISTIALVLILTQTTFGQISGLPGQKTPQLPDRQQTILNDLKNEEIKLLERTQDETIKKDLTFLAWYNLGINLTKQHKIAPTPEKALNPQGQDEEAEEESLFDRAAQAFSTASSIPQQNDRLQAAAIHNRAALFHYEAKRILLQDPDKAQSHITETLNGYKQALSIMPGDTKSADNLELAYLHEADIKIAKEMLEAHKLAAQNCGKALFNFRALKKDKKLVSTHLAEIDTNLKETNKHVAQASQKAKQLKAKQHIQMYAQVTSLVNKSIPNIFGSINDQSLADATEKDIAQAYKLLGGNPDDPENQDQQNQDQDQQNKDQNKQENKDKQDQQKQDQEKSDQENKDKQDQQKQDQQNKDQKQKQSQNQDQEQSDKEKKEQEEKLNADKQEGDFKKEKAEQNRRQHEKNMKNAKIREAEALLRKMGDTEKKVREYIREKKAEQLEKELIKKGIYIEPESNK